MKVLSKCLLTAAITGLSAPAISDINFNGFASIKYGMTTDEDETIYGYDDKGSIRQESLAGLQANADLGNNLSFTLQVLGRGEDSYALNFEWAYFKYQINDNNAITAGRIRIPYYKYSEYVDVSYAYHWSRPPEGVYNVPFNSWDGIGWTNTHFINGWDGQLQLQLGHVETDDIGGPGEAPPELTEPLTYQGASFEYVLSNGSFSARLGYTYSWDLNVGVASIEQAFTFAESPIFRSQTGLPDGPPLVIPEQFKSNLQFDGDNVGYTSASVFYDPGSWFLGLEATSFAYDGEVISPDQDAAFLTTGVRLPKWTLYATYEVVESERRSFAEMLEDTNITDPLLTGVLAGFYEQFVQTVNNAGEDSTSVSLGANYLFHPNATLKFDLTQYDDKDNPPGGRTDATLFSFGVDMVF